MSPFKNVLLKDYLSSAVAPASVSCLSISSASAFLTASFKVLGAPSTKSLASFNPSPEIARTALIT